MGVAEREYDPVSARSRALAENNWLAGSESWLGEIHLAGGSVDHLARHITRLIVIYGQAVADTRLPVMLPESQRRGAERLCAALNRSLANGVVYIVSDGAPSVITKARLFPPELTAAGGIADTVRWNRTLAGMLTPAFLRLFAGEPADDILAGTQFASCLETQTTAVQAARIDLTEFGEPTEVQRQEVIDVFSSAGAGEATHMEIEAVARFDVVVRHQEAAKRPICIGPVLIHADGVAECYGCGDPSARLHASNSAACMRGRALGLGHRCNRCSDYPDPSSA